MALIPNPVGDVLKRVDGTLGTVDDLMRRVDGQLEEVRALLAELEDEMQLLRQVPEMAAKLDEIHRILTTA